MVEMGCGQTPEQSAHPAAVGMLSGQTTVERLGDVMAEHGRFFLGDFCHAVRWRYELANPR
jgi:hypothetical protein